MYLFNIELFGVTISPSVYGLMYALSFLVGFFVLKKRGFFNKDQLDDIFLYVFLGVIFGGRFGYVVFYNLEHYINNYGDILKFWEGGMSFHGGVLGVVFAMIIYSIRNRFNFYKVADQICAVLPIGLGLGRLGNYANSELLGYAGYNGLFAITIKGVNYFPSTLLESLLEGLILYIILTYIYKNRRFSGQVASMFLIGYGVFRMIVELFFRQPDLHIGYVFSIFSVGSLLSIPMILAGLGFYIYLSKKK